jgi:excisionase family DNA binding protein
MLLGCVVFAPMKDSGIIVYPRHSKVKEGKERQKNTPATSTEHPPLTVKSMKVLTVKEAANQLKVKPQWVYRMMHDGGLPFVRLGRLIRIDEDSLATWVAEHRSVG